MGDIGSGGELEDRLHPSYHCRFARKKGFNCGVKVKLTFSEIDDSVSVQGLGEHNHELQVQEEQEGAKNLCWTSEQTKVVMTGVLKEATPPSSGAI